ncbi:methylmalonyl-CoA epimerase [Sphingomonas sp. C3-2]|uniref:methylmalonyl-CoA epimerase n=1 Tax=Sphingomonas sp. C3-2 TaxID=3062169 RepID=UPI00294B1206|nr:methylmalonyl-CoA epimerase [Sphingomonas sp. C3-2]WOK36222.1 methylmalonyl-CoA epimerase [Sphingomonas sp. C3-2]
MAIGRLNHVGVATPSIEKSIVLYRDLMGATKIHEPFDLPPQGVRVCFVDTPNSQIELIEPLGENSPILKFLEKNPLGGQHHVCFEVEDIHAAKAEMEAKGAKVLGEPRIGAHGTPVIFVHPKDMGGVLVELMETPKGDH